MNFKLLMKKITMTKLTISINHKFHKDPMAMKVRIKKENW